MRLYAVLAFLSAFLLFAIQPIAGKALLPEYGGGPAVWTTCMLFFQVMLLAGYAYAHWLGARWHRLHTALVIISIPALALTAGSGVTAAGGGEHPTPDILLRLTLTIGLPFLLLASTSPLLQHWWPGERAHRLYAVSNAGAFIALVAYPFLVEPTLPLSIQFATMAGGYVLFALLSARTAMRIRPVTPTPAVPGGFSATAFWIALSAFASMLLLAVTAQMCQEVASTPFLWVLPLALYLLAFLIAFADDRWYHRRLTALAVGIAVPAACGIAAAGLTVKIWIHVAVYSAALFACALACAGELSRSRPASNELTRFYLAISLGGALGGAFVTIIAPRLFADYSEFYLALAGCCLLTLAGWYRGREWRPNFARLDWALAPAVALFLASAAPLVAMSYRQADKLHTWRNFYGILRITEHRDQVGTRRTLTHGRVTHGLQYLDAGKRTWPTSYYGWDSGVGRVLEYYPRPDRQPLRVGVIGLGVGTLAAYARRGDLYRFYEINPDVRAIAQGQFSYLKDSAGTIKILLGDARMTMEHEPPQRYDVLAVDAFSSDSIPAHLLTVECGAVYQRHLKPDGALLLHISNHSIDLAPVARGLAQRYGWESAQLHSAGDDSRGTHAATWVVLTSNRRLLEIEPVREAATPWSNKDRPPILWTDDYSSLWRLLKW